jgi:hypothetical protein
MNPSWAGGREADPELSGVLGVSAGHEGGCFFVAHLYETDFVLAHA